MTSESLDVMALTGRLLSIGSPARSLDEAHWGISAIDRLRGFFDGRQAELINEASLLVQFPPLPPTDADTAAAGTADGSAGSSAAGAGDPPAADVPPLDLPPLAGPAPSLSRQERERRERRAWIVALCPRFAAALSRGSLTTGHIDILASVLQGVCESVRERVLDQEDDLLTAALAGSPEFLARAVRRAIDRVVERDGIDRAARQRANSKLREWDDAATGMHHVHLELDPELALRFTASLGAEVEAMFHGGAAKGLSADRVAALALVNLMAASQGGTRRSNPDRVQFLVVCDFDTLFAGLHDRSILETAGGTAIHLETARRLWCDGEITTAITIDGKVESLISDDELANRRSGVRCAACTAPASTPGAPWCSTAATSTT